MILYNEKIIQSGSMCEIYQYSTNQKTGFKRIIKYQRKKTGKKNSQNLNRVRKNIKRYMYSNFNKSFQKFLTFTFDPKKFPDIDITDPTITNFYFAKFIRKFKSKYPNLRYIVVIEQQDNQNIHYHMVCNIRAKIDFTFLLNAWSYGFVKPETINSIEKATFYISKYISKFKDLPDNFLNKKLYFISKNLIKSIVTTYLNLKNSLPSFDNYSVLKFATTFTLWNNSVVKYFLLFKT